MFKLFKSANKIWQAKELREKIYYTVLCVSVYILGTRIVLPGIVPSLIQSASGKEKGLLAILDKFIMLGSHIKSYSVLSLGVQPYITASIMIRLGSLTVPYLQRLQKEGAVGNMKLTQIMRWMALGIAPVLAIGQIQAAINLNIVDFSTFFTRTTFTLLNIILIIAGTTFAIWLADRITEQKIVDGTSALICISTLIHLPSAIWEEVRVNNTQHLLFLIFEMSLFTVFVLVIIVFTQAVRKIPLQYAQQVMSRKIYHNNAYQHLPIKLNSSGIMPIIAARTLIALLKFTTHLLSDKLAIAKKIDTLIDNSFSWQYRLILAIAIFFSNFFYTAIFSNPREIANELERSGGFIPGVKPGQPTANYIDIITSRITLPSSLFLAFIAVVPAFVHYLGVSKQFSEYIGGTSMIILVGTLIDMIEKINGHLSIQYYNRMVRSSQAAIDNR